MAEQTVSLRLEADTGAFRSDLAASGQVADELAGKVTSAGDEITSSLQGATTATQELGEANRGAAGFWDDHSASITAAGLAIAGVGAGLEAFNRSQQDTRFVASRVANTLEGESTDSIIGYAAEVHDATRDLDDMIASMEVGAQQGIRSGPALQRYAVFWDTVGDATGESALSLAQASSALRAVGVAAGQEDDALAAFGYVARETTGSVSDFLSFLEKTGPELGEMGADVNDAATILGILEHEFGMAGRTARTEFRAAVNESDGTLQGLLETLGITEAQFGTYMAQVEASSGVIAENAAAYKETRTPLQEMQAQLDAMLLKFSGVTTAAGSFVPVLLGAGGIVTGLNQFRQLAPGVVSRVGSVARSFTTLSGAVRGLSFGAAAAGLLILNQRLGDNARAASRYAQEIAGGFSDPERQLANIRRELEELQHVAGRGVRLDAGPVSLFSSGEAREAEDRIDALTDKAADLELQISLNADAASEAEGAFDGFGDELSDSEAAAEGAAEAQRDLFAAMDEVISSALAGRDAVAAWEGGLDDLRDSVRENGATLDLTTEAGRRNHEIMGRLVQAGNERIQTMINEGASADEVRTAQYLMGEQLSRTAGQLGFNNEQAYYYTETLRRVPTSVTTTARFDNAAAMRALWDYQGLVNQMGGGSVAQFIRLGGRATGGPVSAGEAYMVGEEGPEILFMPRDGHVYNAADTATMLAPPIAMSGGSSGVARAGGGSTREVIQVVLDGRVVAEAVRNYQTDVDRRNGYR